jgi:hypothetical protein
LTLCLEKDDAAAHISEEEAGAARAAPIAILVSVAFTTSLGWLLLIAASFATSSVPDLLSTTLPLPMGQLFLNILGKRGMLTIWSFIIVVQARRRTPIRTLLTSLCSLSREQHKALTQAELCLLSPEIMLFQDLDGGSR